MDPQQEAVLKKIAWRIVPLLTLAYVVNYLDRTNIGFAALTMNEDLGFTATEFGYGAGILFLGYTVFEIPSNLALYRFGARRWIARIMITWGLVSALTALVVGVKSYYLARFALGVAEAGFFPASPIISRRGFRPNTAPACSPGSSSPSPCPGGRRPDLACSWSWMGCSASRAGNGSSSSKASPRSFLGIVVLRVLADRPDDATWLGKGARHPGRGCSMGTPRAAEIERPHCSLGPPRRLLAVVQFGFTLGLTGSAFPAADHQDQRPLQYGGELPAAVPYVFASVGMIWWAWRVDRTGKKIGNLTIALVAALGLACLGASAISSSRSARSPWRWSESPRRAPFSADPDPVPEWRRRRRRPRLHQFDRHHRQALPGRI
jgi:MFS family permease